jgi:hypothetical protein
MHLTARRIDMKKISLIIAPIILLSLSTPAFAQEAEITPTTEAGENLDLVAVLDLFQDSENLEEFEKALNTEENGINNIDLDEDGEVDYIRVMEQSNENTRVIVLQAMLGENEYQDVATIEVEKKGEEDVTLQAVGNEELYGENYCVEPVEETSTTTTTTIVHVYTWPVVRVIFLPGYRMWRSPWRWGLWPGWWRPWRPLPIATYRARHVRRSGFRITRRRRVRTSHFYKPRSSRRASQKTRRGARTQPKKTQPKRKTGTKPSEQPRRR